MTHPLRAMLSLLAVLALALGVAACGGDDESSGGGESASRTEGGEQEAKHGRCRCSAHATDSSYCASQVFMNVFPS